jgi:hypothetical protein
VPFDCSPSFEAFKSTRIPQGISIRLVTSRQYVAFFDQSTFTNFDSKGMKGVF